MQLLFFMLLPFKHVCLSPKVPHLWTYFFIFTVLCYASLSVQHNAIHIGGDIHGTEMSPQQPLRVKRRKKTKLHLSQAHRLPSVGLQTEVQIKKHYLN